MFRSPNQYQYFKTSFKIKPKDVHKGCIVIFDDMFGARNSSQNGEFPTRGRHEDLDICLFSLVYFCLPR